ncbi:MAG: oxygen-independent coproporphyrinogen III oxidase [Clostridia bacterium]|nr:oxygen-independent coproporphyrinogen III oxidase [Clostridia bacterium]
MKKEELGIYIHIPFCKSKCYYCDFTSYTNQNEKIEGYIKKVIEEMKQYQWNQYNITTIYIGGGTPSYLEEKDIIQLMEKLKQHLLENQTSWETIEITMEMNPGTITEQKLNQYKKAGVNRISIGLQTTKDTLLKEIGRIHTYQEFLDAYQLAKKVGFDNINVDFMIGLPNQTIQDIKDTLEEIQKLDPTHISVYSLIVEENTKMEAFIAKGELQLPDEETERQMYWYVKNKLEQKGYRHYEISNFAKIGKESKHNLNCWEQKQYIGLGATAHSYLHGVRFSNSAFTKQGEWNWNDKKIEEEQTLEDMKKEYMLLGLRKIEGVNIQNFKEKFIQNPIFIFRNEIQKLVKEELLMVDGNFIRLTNKGIDFANLVWEEFI